MANKYDHRLRNAIVASGNPNLFWDLGIPKSTIRDWFRKGPASVITSPEFEATNQELTREIRELKIALAAAEAKTKLVSRSVTILGFQLQFLRVPSADKKSQIIQAIRSASSVLPLEECLDAVKLSSARFRAWVVRQRECKLEDSSSCPKLSPTKLLPIEVKKIKEFVLDPAYRHFSITSLALYAKKCGDVVASTSTWGRT